MGSGELRAWRFVLACFKFKVGKWAYALRSNVD